VKGNPSITEVLKAMVCRPGTVRRILVTRQ